MDHFPFIFGAYAVTLGGLFAMLGASYAQMRRAERDAEALRKERRR